MSNDLNSLFNTAAQGDSALVSLATSNVLMGSANNTLVVAGAAGADAENIESSETNLLTILIDNSPSIGYSGLEDAVRDGYNAMIAKIANSKQADSQMIAVWTFNETGNVVHSYVPVADAERLTAGNYKACGSGTALYDTWYNACAANVAYAQTLRNTGMTVRSTIVILTDGDDVCSRKKASECAALSRDLLKSEQFILAFVGAGKSDFRATALSMGIPDKCIKSVNADPSDILHILDMVSKSQIAASQGLIQPGADAGFFASN